MLRALVAARWHREHATCVMIGDTVRCFIVAPIEAIDRVRLAVAAAERGVPTV